MVVLACLCKWLTAFPLCFHATRDTIGLCASGGQLSGYHQPPAWSMCWIISPLSKKKSTQRPMCHTCRSQKHGAFSPARLVCNHYMNKWTLLQKVIAKCFLGSSDLSFCVLVPHQSFVSSRMSTPHELSLEFREIFWLDKTSRTSSLTFDAFKSASPEKQTLSQFHPVPITLGHSLPLSHPLR